MADQHDAVKIQRMLFGKAVQEIDGFAEVLIGARPTATVVTDAPILDVPGGDALLRQRLRHRAETRGRAILRAPAAAVNQHRHRKATVAGRQRELTEARWLGSITDRLRLGCSS